MSMLSVLTVKCTKPDALASILDFYIFLIALCQCCLSKWGGGGGGTIVSMLSVLTVKCTKPDALATILDFYISYIFLTALCQCCPSTQ